MSYLRMLVVTILLGSPVMLHASDAAGDVMVQAERDGAVITDLTRDGATLVTQIQYIGLEAANRNLTSAIHFSGKSAQPNATVIVMIPDLQWQQSATVSEAGEWSLVVPTSNFTSGSYYAYVAVEGESTGSKPVAYFTVLTREAWSPSTWIFIGTGIVAILALFGAVTLQLSYNTKHHPVV